MSVNMLTKNKLLFVLFELSVSLTKLKDKLIFTRNKITKCLIHKTKFSFLHKVLHRKLVNVIQNRDLRKSLINYF